MQKLVWGMARACAVSMGCGASRELSTPSLRFRFTV